MSTSGSNIVTPDTVSAKEHYNNHLARVYAWMLGDREARITEQFNFFTSHGIQPGMTKRAIDLGAGNGIQSIALARLGFAVTAVDFSPALIGQLLQARGTLSIKANVDDILNFMRSTGEPVDVVVCMGDTLTHLPNAAQVDEVIQEISRCLTPGGMTILSYRDFSAGRHGSDRFIHVRSDDARSMTCFLEYFNDHVVVYDIITEKIGGSWTQAVSSYPKLRLPKSAVLEKLQRANINVRDTLEVRGMTYIIGQKD